MLLEINDLRITVPTKRGSVTVVDGVNLELDEGEIVGVAGESGCGKTMTALSLLRILPRGARTSGKSLLAGRDLLTMRARELRRVRGKEIGIVFQDPSASLHPMVTIERQLTDHMKRHIGLKGPPARKRAQHLLEQVRIPDAEAALRGYPHQFSGGMLQRIAIAMALACDPKLLIADEPTTALDVTVQAGILHLLESIRSDTGLGVLLISHDLGLISAISDRLYVFYAGRVVETGPTSELLPSPRHPYTDALLRALPHPHRRDELLLPIPGAPPPPGSYPAGCVFAPRCAYAQQECMAARPALAAVTEVRRSACAVDPLSKPRHDEYVSSSAS